jgi:ATP-dependent DNA helicase RecG
MDIKFLKGVGDKRAEAFAKIGVKEASDFLSFIPRMYLQKITIRNIPQFRGQNVLIYGKVTDINIPYKMNQPIKLFVNDGTGTTEIPVFGGKEFRSKQFRLYENILFWGKVDEGYFNTKFRLEYRDHLKLSESDQSDKNFLKYTFLPVYELSGVLKKTWVKPLLLSKIVFNAFNAVINRHPEYLDETLPAEIVEKYNFPSHKDAVLRINFPLSFDDIESARRRLAFEELFYLEIIMALRKRIVQAEKKGISFDKDVSETSEKFKSSLPFELTNAQVRVIEEIRDDMKSSNVMNRLLQGDVGSGKTVVAIDAMLTAIANGYQSAFMCPTELLAEQHFATVTKFTEPLGTKVRLLVGGQKKKLRNEILSEIKEGTAEIVVGTHALIQETVEFKSLGLVVIDEQHKFGVMQRAKLKEKGLNPDVLVMTATPIPRTLSLTYYGDLDVSIIDELPAHRKKIITGLRSDEEKDKVYNFIRGQVKEGRQVYIIYPIIDESEKLDLKSAEEGYKNLKENIFPDLRIGMVHGRVLSYEKDEEMQKFKRGELDVLVSTTVIEVGIDVPNATVMVIEDAQRFGLSQLHQLRGRVGRGADQSYCILIAKNLDVFARERLTTLVKTNDGFEIAEKDMELRGPGEFFGIRQSGALNFSCTDLNKDKDLVERAKDIAFGIIEKDPQLRAPENHLIRQRFIRDYKDSLYLMNIA